MGQSPKEHLFVFTAGDDKAADEHLIASRTLTWWRYSAAELGSATEWAWDWV